MNPPSQVVYSKNQVGIPTALPRELSVNLYAWKRQVSACGCGVRPKLKSLGLGYGDRSRKPPLNQGFKGVGTS